DHCQAFAVEVGVQRVLGDGWAVGVLRGPELDWLGTVFPKAGEDFRHGVPLALEHRLAAEVDCGRWGVEHHRHDQHGARVAVFNAWGVIVDVQIEARHTSIGWDKGQFHPSPLGDTPEDHHTAL